MKIMCTIFFCIISLASHSIENHPYGNVLKNANRYLYLSCIEESVETGCRKLAVIHLQGKKELLLNEFKIEEVDYDESAEKIDEYLWDRLNFDHMRTAIIGTRASIYVWGLALDKLGIFPYIEDKKNLRFVVTIIGALPGLVFDIVKLPLEAVFFGGRYVLNQKRGEKLILHLFGVKGNPVKKIREAEFDIMRDILSH